MRLSQLLELNDPALAIDIDQAATLMIEDYEKKKLKGALLEALAVAFGEADAPQPTSAPPSRRSNLREVFGDGKSMGYADALQMPMYDGDELKGYLNMETGETTPVGPAHENARWETKPTPRII